MPAYRYLLLVLLLAVNRLAAQAPDTSRLRLQPLVRSYELAPVHLTADAGSIHAALHHYYQGAGPAATEEILSKLPGLSLIRRGNYAQEPVLRGLSSQRLVVAIDGMRIAEACTDNMDPITSYIEPQHLQRIDIDAGGAGSAQGSSVGGGLHFRLKKPQLADTACWTGQAELRVQPRGLVQRAALGYSAPRQAFYGSFTYRHLDDYRAGGGTLVRLSGFEKVNYSLAWRQRLPGGDDLSIDWIGDHAWQVGYPALPMDVAFAHANIAALSYQHGGRGSGLLHWEAKLYANRVDHAMDDTRRDSVAMHMDMPGYTRSAGAYWQARWLRGDHLIDLKADVYAARVHAEMTMYPDEGEPMYMLTWPHLGRQTAGLYLADRWQYGRRWHLDATLRSEVQQVRVGSDLGLAQLLIFYPGYAAAAPQPLWAGSLALQGALCDHVQFEARLAYGERLPSNSEAFGYYLFSRFDGYDYLGNPFLRKERSLQGELALRRHSRHWHWEGSGFVYGFGDYILAREATDYRAMTIGARGVKVYANMPRAYMAGAELAGIYRPGPHWQWSTTAQYVWAATGEGDPLPLIPPLQVQSALRWQHGRCSVQGEGIWNAAQRRVATGTGEQATPAFVLCHLRGSYQPGSRPGNWQVSAGVENLFDTVYRQHLDWGQIPRPGRLCYLSATWRLAVPCR
ncbi:MAG: TonB-dependent copper receptor [Bacteroidia bacterium]